MDARFLSMDPLRRPQWRADRAMQLVEQCQRPRRWDDRPVREYCWFLYDSLAASGNKQRLLEIETSWPNVVPAHELHYHPDQEWRHILEARLLTREPFPDIAKRFSMPPGAVDCYEKLFFNVCDRLECHEWIAKIVRDIPEDRDWNRHGVITEQQRAMAYRWFGFYGGPLALDAVVYGLSPTVLTSSTSNVAAWCDEAFRQTIRSNAVQSACALQINRHNVMQLLKLYVRQRRAATGSRKRNDPPIDTAKNIEVFLDQFAACRGSSDV